jgi:hypothetical protein
MEKVFEREGISSGDCETMELGFDVGGFGFVIFMGN